MERAASVGGGLFLHSLRLVRLSEAYALLGRRQDALSNAEQALALARQCGERGSEAYTLRFHGEIAAHADLPEVGLGTLNQKLGRHAEPRAELTTAAELYRAMDMAFWLEKAEGNRSALC